MMPRLIRIAPLILGVSTLYATTLFTPLPQEVAYDKNKAILGKKLYMDTKLSKDGTVACVSCHELQDGSGVDHLPTSTGIKGQQGPVNAPTVYNAVYNFVQFWDGRAKDLQEQAAGPVENPVEMGDTFSNVIQKLKNDEAYVKLFEKIYDGKITKETITDAIAEFEKALVTPNSKFDQFLRGNKDALNEIEKEGFALFQSKGCVSCHNGINLGGNLYQKAGVFEQFPQTDNFTGRYAVTGDEKDKYFVKVPTLRNISKTAPYFHHGRTSDLRTAVMQMGYYQLGISMSLEEADKIVAFLKTLEGEVPEIAK
jgi:cytochrome c peroxidase